MSCLFIHIDGAFCCCVNRTRLAQGGQAAVVDPAAERGNLADVPEGPEVGSGRSSVQPWNKTAETTAHSIEDDTFFPALPDMLHNISDRLDKIMAAGTSLWHASWYTCPETLFQMLLHPVRTQHTVPSIWSAATYSCCKVCKCNAAMPIWHA